MLILWLDPESGERNAFRSNTPAAMPVARLIQMSGQRRPIEQRLEIDTQQLGMGEDEVQSWTGWQHHMTLVILAHFFLVRR